MMHRKLPVIALLSAVFLSGSTVSQAGLNGRLGVLKSESAHFGRICRKIDYAKDYLMQIDFNNDKRQDFITTPSGVTCDGVRAPECSSLGCPYRFYVQLSDGSYHLAAEMQLFDWKMRLRYGNMVFVMKMQGSFCDRTPMETCKVEYRVRGTKFVELLRE